MSEEKPVSLDLMRQREYRLFVCHDGYFLRDHPAIDWDDLPDALWIDPFTGDGIPSRGQRVEMTVPYKLFEQKTLVMVDADEEGIVEARQLSSRDLQYLIGCHWYRMFPDQPPRHFTEIWEWTPSVGTRAIARHRDAGKGKKR